MIRRRTGAVVVMAVVISTLTVASVDAGAWTDGACTTPSGVTVVVDFQELGGGVHVRCAPQPVANGFEALRQAGIEFATTVRFPGFLCRIAGEPASDPCQTTSPATAYWSYWIAQRGSTWCYSNQGAGNRTPPAGSVEGWSFSLGRSSATAPAPRAVVPTPLPGAAPAPLSTGDCARGADAPSPSPTAAPVRPTPPAVDPPSPAPSGVANGATPPGSDPPAGATARTQTNAGGAVGTPGDGKSTTEGAAPGATRTPSSPGPDPDAAPAAGGPGGDPDEQDAAVDEVDGGGADDGAALQDERTAAIDLGADPDRPSSPVGVVAAALLMAALTGGALLTRRRSRVDTSA